MGNNKHPLAVEMPSIDHLFSTEDERQMQALEHVQMLPLVELHPFKNHPFEVRDDEDMTKMIESIKEYGIMTPAIVRPCKDGGYEIVSGHRRSYAAVRAGLQEMPAIVREMDDDTAIILMVDANVQREHIMPMEKARAFRMKLDALKRQGQRTDLTSGQVGHMFSGVKTREIIARDNNESARNVQRYIRLNNLIPPLQQMVDDNILKFNPAVEISYLKETEQKEFYDYIESQFCTPSLSQAQHLKEASRAGTLDADKLERIMTEQAPSVAPRPAQVTLSMERLSGFFPKGTTKPQMEQEVMKILENYFRQLEQGQEQSMER